MHKFDVWYACRHCRAALTDPYDLRSSSEDSQQGPLRALTSAMAMQTPPEPQVTFQAVAEAATGPSTTAALEHVVDAVRKEPQVARPTDCMHAVDCNHGVRAHMC